MMQTARATDTRAGGATVASSLTAERPVSPHRLRLPEGLLGDPEWEAMKAARRPLSHAQAVAECARLSNQYRKMWVRMAGVTVDLNAILQTLRAKKIPFVLTGAHGIAGWTGRPCS